MLLHLVCAHNWCLSMIENVRFPSLTSLPEMTGSEIFSPNIF